eukprot:NODE_26792_length_537_cov_9.687805.p1 GENE.NODE_26792_length_537_cov_9.687805~~NODE_26792_length_537_cov_9.687805.p1  ORF type:complete len:125 (+),score=21.97 NODE_26792_length_537_cov_9.687805:82-456(+)
MAVRIVQFDRIPFGLVQSHLLVIISAVWLWLLGRFWHLMVIELPKDLGNLSQMTSLSMLVHSSLPMRETNDTAFEYRLEHVLCVAIALALLMSSWAPSRADLEKTDKGELATKAAKAIMKSKKA